jgi:hypothetical protein
MAQLRTAFIIGNQLAIWPLSTKFFDGAKTYNKEKFLFEALSE